jgi:hypothetical protein
MEIGDRLVASFIGALLLYDIRTTFWYVENYKHNRHTKLWGYCILVEIMHMNRSLKWILLYCMSTTPSNFSNTWYIFAKPNMDIMPLEMVSPMHFRWKQHFHVIRGLKILCGNWA